MILGLPVRGHALTHTELGRPMDYGMTQWHDLRMTEEGRKKMYKDGVKLAKVRERYHTKPENPSPEFVNHDTIVYTRAYLLYFIGGVLFPTGSRNIVHPSWIVHQDITYYLPS